MVNHNCEEFFIYAEPLLNVCKHANNVTRIKRKDNYPDERAAHHPGEIYCSIDDVTEENTTYTRLRLYLGAAETLIKFNSSGTELLNVIEEQEFIFPKAEFVGFIKSIRAMHDQHETYTMLISNIDILPTSNRSPLVDEGES